MTHYIKIHKSYRNVIAICDSSLLGKKFEEDIRQLDVRENFYKDKEVSKEDLIKTMISQKKEDATFNIVGQESVSAAKEALIINDENIGHVAGIPFALTLI